MKAKLETTMKLGVKATAAGGQTDSSSLIGRKYRVVDTKYGHDIGEYDTPSEAEKAMLARPYSKIMSHPDLSTTPEVRDLARKRLVKTSPDIDAGGLGSGRHKERINLLENSIANIRKAMQDLKDHGTERMSKNGVKMALRSHRETMRRIKLDVKDLKRRNKLAVDEPNTI